MTKFTHKKSIRGVTLVEIMIATLIGGFMIFVGSQLFGLLDKTRRATEDTTVARTMEIIGNRQLWFDVRSSGPSFNSIIIEDDVGRDFYDFDSSINCSGSTPGLVAQCQRSFTLPNADVAKTSFVLIGSWNRQARSTRVFDPSEAYDVDTSAGWDVDAPMNFENAGLHDALINGSLLSPGPTNPGVEKKFILMKSAGQSPELNSSGMPIAGSIVRPSTHLIASTILGTSKTLQVAQPSWLDIRHPEDTTLSLSDTDTFLRTIPPLGGRAGLVQANEVKLLRYCLRADTTSKIADAHILVRQSCNTENATGCTLDAACVDSDAGWGNSFDVAFNVKSVVFKRGNINLPTVFFDINLHKSR